MRDAPGIRVLVPLDLASYDARTGAGGGFRAKRDVGWYS